jgi:hypothetical protein
VNDFESDNYYPEIIKPTTFLKIQSRVEHNATKRGGSKLGKVPNLFRGLIHCACCGNDIGVRLARVKKQNYSYMACRKSQVNICADKTIWKMNELEERIFAFVLEKTPDELLVKPTPKANANTIAKLKLDLSQVKVAIKHTLQRSEKFPDLPEIDAMLTELDAKRKTLQERIATEESKIAAVTARPASVAKLKGLMAGVDYEALDKAADSIHYRLQDDVVRAELRNIMPDVIRRITCDLAKWEYDVEFASGETKHFDFYL